MTASISLRLAFRIEGDVWNAYVAPTDSMNNALLLGSIRITAVADQPKRKAAFMELMKASMGDFVRSIGSDITAWNDPVTAPEHEKAGRA
jgi:hypothetical protein